ncbi:AAA domain-containing protein [Candidatus Poriferisocius sp.]|uniref:AAA domain-containing protein n=1 Tax=Candidatus Poriferisocius sp. TaxID=3101276 RepID=UPI003B01970F
MNRRETVERAAEQWAKELTDESGRNRLLYYRELRVGTLSLGDADPRALKSLLGGKKVRAQELFPNDHFDDAVRRIRAVNRKAVANYEEKGINTLFLGWGMATWKPASSSATPNAPVLLCPVDLERTGAAEVDFDLRLSGDWTLNEALLQHLDNEFDVDVSGESLMDPYGDGEQISEKEEQAIFAELSRRAERVPGFDIDEQVVLGNFMFKKMPMVNDINNNIEALARHNLIAAIAGDEEAEESVRADHASTVTPSMPDHTPPQQEFLVLDADSSQNAAINAALAGESFVLQGPPGTGKSQTISNLIATMMAQGKSVLFVAEKRAAIDAVSKRLTKVGLDGFVMDLHGGVSSRKELARQLDKSFAAIKQTPQVDHQDLHQKLELSRQELSGYAEALHSERKPWGISYFEVLWRLMQLEASGSQNGDKPQPLMWIPPPALSELDEAVAQQVRRDIRDWADWAEPLCSGRSPWSGARITTDKEARRALDACTRLSYEIISAWQAQQRVLADDLGIDDPGSISRWGEVVGEVADLARGIAKTELALTLDVFDRDVNRLAEDMVPAAKNVFIRLFNKRYKAAKAELKSLQPESSTLERRAAAEAVDAARNQARRWAELGCIGLPRVPANAEEAAEAFAEMKNTIDELALLLPEGRLAAETIDGISQTILELLDDQRTLLSLPRLAEVEQRLQVAHVGPLIDRVADNALSPAGLEAAFDYSWLRSIQRDVLLAGSRLTGFQGSRQSRYVKEFQQNDAKHLDQAPARVARRVAESAVKALNQNPGQNQLIRKEARKKTRHLPLRSLFERAPEALTALRPCWAMSPLDVAQTLPPQPLFDLVVFDEASQVMPCDAIPALLRGRRAMVAGDSHQLPPTSFFDTTSADNDLDEEEESVTDYESILDVMDSRLNRHPLTWHYRSQDERLIAYSNQEIYDGGLTTFPGADADQRLDWVLVPHREGVATENGSNSDEVQRVVDLMIDHAHQRPEESLGVTAMGLHHASHIEEALRQRIERENKPEFEEFFKESHMERAFVKNLERVQGDERDAIILSIGYGKNAAGKMQYRFGPLNMQGGERRLNVAITRARKRMTLVSSFAFSDMDPDRTKSTGANMLRGFLKFAQSGGTELDGADERTPLNPFEVDIVNELRSAGLDVVPQYGCSGYRIDFAVRHPTRTGQFALAVEADGVSYNSSPTARDRDRLRQEHLERLGWRFCRIWSTDWFNDHRHEVDRVLAAYKQAVAGIDLGMVTPPRTLDSAPALQGLAPDSDLPARDDRPRVRRYPSINEYSHHELVQLVKWIKSDGLLRTDDELFEELFQDLGFGRRGQKIVDALNEAIDSAG